MQDKLLIFSFVLFGLNCMFFCMIYIGLLKVESSLSNLISDVNEIFDH